MRVLFTINPAPGHLFALVPLAWAMHLRGHEVLVAAPRSMGQQIRRAGLSHAVVGGDASFFELWPAHVPLGGNDTLDLAVFAAIAERTGPDVVALARAWRPDLIVTEPVEYAAPLAATLLGVPWVLHHWGLPVPGAVHRAALADVADRLLRLAETLGVDGATAAPLATVDTCPPSLRLPGSVSGVALPMRYVPYNSASTLPDWLFAPRVRPRVCVSMGTVPIPEGVDGLTAAVAGMRDLDVEVVVSGAGVHGIEDLPPNARRVGWLPHHVLLPTCDLFVHHGGSGSSMAALGAGRPQLVLPQMCDQFSIADRLTAAGVARSVAFADRSPDAVRTAVRALLADTAVTRRAGRVRDEIAALPAPPDVAATLAGLTNATRPGMVEACAGTSGY
ncbi:nucleotide disphospho-sugar-binding domain-containing protein [Dactylosporangium sp. NPDC049525]|uniref:nucleotide disphospho-sugar-binding domain-containing protein n=1 Tax=Dactylosporangium sp. NPDC049525 TaxID=3154730 RepID=UPI0034324D27